MKAAVTDITIAYSADPRRDYVAGAFYLAASVVFPICINGQFLRNDMRVGFHVILAFASVLFALIGLGFLARGLMKLRLASDGVSLTLFGKELWHCTTDRVGLFCKAEYSVKAGYSSRKIKLLGISCQTPVYFAALRESKLAKSWLTRDDLPFRKHKAHWQEKFAREHLIRQARKGRTRSIQKDILWMEWTMEGEVLLQGIFPEITWVEVTQKDLYT